MSEQGTICSQLGPFCKHGQSDYLIKMGPDLPKELSSTNGFLSSNGHSSSNAPDKATDAVLKPSAPVAASARAVKGLEFNDYRDKPLTVEDLVKSMGGMGFQATAVSEAVRIVNDMVIRRTHDQMHVFQLN